MKNNPTLHDEIELNNLGKRGNGAAGQQRFKLGLDVELRNVAVAIQRERGTIGLAQKFSLQQLCNVARIFRKRESHCGGRK